MMMTATHIDKGRLSFCFKSLGNIVRCLFNDCSGLFGVYSEFVRGYVCSPRGLARTGSCSGTFIIDQGLTRTFEYFFHHLTIP